MRDFTARVARGPVDLGSTTGDQSILLAPLTVPRSPLAVVVRCFNEEAHIGRLLTGIRRQTVQPDEIVVVDSGSTDATLAIASAFDRVRIVHIAPEDFSFGRALNRGIAASECELLAFASAHVYPVYTTWLERLTDTFDDPDVGLAYGRQLAPPDGSWSEGRLLERWFPAHSVPRQRDPFCNNANAAIRRSLWTERRYDEELTGLEDLDWATWLTQRGGVLSYRADAPVVHVHEQTFPQVVNRYRREAIAHKAIDSSQSMSAAEAARLAVHNIVGDLTAATRAGVVHREALDVLQFRVGQFYGAYRGFRHEGSVSSILRRRFYYPPKRQGADAVGSGGDDLINYDEPATEREGAWAD